MPKFKVSTLKQTPYVFARAQEGKRVDPTRQEFKKAIDEGRFSQKIMDQHYYSEVVDEIIKKTQDPAEMDRLMYEYHNERIAELIRTREAWPDKPDRFPITVNQFDEVTAGNHRFRVVRYLGVTEVEVNVVEEPTSRRFDEVPEIWE